MRRFQPLMVRWIIALLLLALAGVLAAEPRVVAGLAASAWYWQARSRDDKAVQAWTAVLAADPDQPDALAALGGADARAGRLDPARDALTHLLRVAPSHPDVPVLRREIELGPRMNALLKSARALVHSGRVAEGVARYREAFGNAGPPGDLAIEYYQTVAGTPNGWSEARAGLQSLVDRAPGEPRFRIALAKLLTYRTETRRQGIATLADLARDPSVSREATESWREALLWLGASPGEEPLLRAYLAAHPGDAEVARALERARVATGLEQGYAALKRGDAAEAERRFAEGGDVPEARRGLSLAREREANRWRKAAFAALRRGELDRAEELFRRSGLGPDAKVGLALVAQRRAVLAQRQGDFARARALVDEARQLAPRRSAALEAALRSTEFWSLVGEAEAARARGRDDVAQTTLEEALRRGAAEDRWHAELALADLRASHGERAEAEGLYRTVLAARPAQPEALRGLTSLLFDAGRYQDALAENEKLLRVAPRKALDPGLLRAEELRARARRSREAGDRVAARAALESARGEAPDDVWVLHDLAQVLLDTGAVEQARPVLDDLLRVAPRLPQARVLQARYLAARGEGGRALEVLSSLPPASMDDGVRALQRRLEVQVRVPELVQRAGGPRRAAAIADLAALQGQVEEDPSLAAEVARAWSAMGEYPRAVALFRSVIDRSPRASAAELKLELASTLRRSGDEGAARALLAELAHAADLTPEQRRWLADLRIGDAVSTADRRREAGDPDGASEALASVLRDYPDDPRIVSALARTVEATDPARAHATYLRLLARDPADAESRRGAVDTALAVRERGEARALAEEGTRRAPQDPGAWLLAARAAESSGDDHGAMQALDEAEQRLAQRASRSPAAMGSGASDPIAGAPDPAASATPGLRPQIDAMRDRIGARHRPGVEGSGAVRLRQGEPGLSGLTEYRASVGAELPVASRGFAFVHGSEVQLDAEAISSSAATRFGTSTWLPSSSGFQARGTAVSAGYRGEHLSLEIGSSPLGFPVQSLLGSVRVQGGLGPLRLALEGARQSVTESMLSYAGVRDPGSGLTWGGVVSQGGRAELSLELAPVRVYAYGGYDWLVGTNVADNRRVQAGGGVDVTVLRGRAGELSLGVSGLGMEYERNLRFFTFGHGGYFSPQQFARGGAPVRWRREGPVHVELEAEPGFEWFREDGAPAFPVAPGDVATASQDPYLGQRVTGPTVEAHALLGWSFAPGFEVRATAAFQHAPEFQELQAGLMLRFGSDR